MPLSTALRKLLCCAPREQEEAEAPPIRAEPEPVADEPVQPGRPYQDYVENETERYWREMVKVGSLTKPDLQEIRAGATPVLGLAQRYRPGPKLNPVLNRAHMAVNAMHLHAEKSGWIKPPYSRPETSPNYVEALIQLADDADWLPREISLPDHPAPHHPPIYYTIDPATNRPLPWEDALIRGDYVFDPETGARITQDNYIRPWRRPGVFPSANDLMSRGWDACYSLHGKGARMRLFYHWLTGLPGELWITVRMDRLFSPPISTMHFSPYPPARAEAPAMQPVPEPA